MPVALAADSVDVILRDGRTLRLRPPGRDDADSLLEFFGSLSERSRYLRFHGFPSLRPQLVEPLLEPDWIERGALLGALSTDAGEEIVAVASYVRLRDPAIAEAAFAVADAHQRRGIGTRLLERLADRASEVGIERFVAEVMADNRDMLGVFEAVGFELTRELAGGELEVQFPIASTERYRERVEERDHAAVTASLRPFFEPRTIAVIGASRRRGSIGGELFRNILAGDFAGAAYPVNRDGEPVAGVRAYRSVAEIPDDVDVAVVSLPGSAVLEAVEEALEAGVEALVVISAGFAEVGREGAERQERLLELVRSHGGRLIGPNCLGIAVAGVSLNATFAARTPASGNIGFSSQSGALGVAFLEAAEARGLGLSAFVSIGNKADVSSNDLLEWWEDDPHTDVVLLYLESFGNPRRFGRLARRVARRKPILASEERDDAVRAARCELAHGGARRLRGGRRCTLPPGGRDSRDVARGADRCRSIAVEPARAEGQARRPPHQRRRAGDPVRGRLRRRRARAPRPDGRDTRGSSPRSSRPRRASRIPSTCWAAPRPTRTGGRSPRCSAIRSSTRSSCSSCRR